MGRMGETSISGSGHLRVDDQKRLQVDLPCVRCGYNLRMQHVEDGCCPECDLPVGRSVLGQVLRFANPDWLARIWWGTNRFATAIGCAALLIAFVMLVDLRSASGWAFWPVNLVIVTLVAMAVAFTLAGFWRASTPDPDATGREALWSCRRLIRAGLFVYLPLVGAGVMIAHWFPDIPLPWSTRTHVAWHHTWTYQMDYPTDQLAALIMAAGPVLLVLLLLWHICRLARRIPDRTLTMVLLLVMLVYGLCHFVWLLVTFNPFLWIQLADDLIAWLIQEPGSDLLEAFVQEQYEPVMWLAFACALTYLPLIGMLIWIWLVFRRQARWAREHWAGA